MECTHEHLSKHVFCWNSALIQRGLSLFGDSAIWSFDLDIRENQHL